MTIQQAINTRDLVIVEAYDKRTNRLAYSKHLSMDSPHFHVVGLSSPFRVRENSTLILPQPMVTTLRNGAQISNAEFLLPAVGYTGQTEIELKSIPISILSNGELTIDSPIDAETLRRVSFLVRY